VEERLFDTADDERHIFNTKALRVAHPYVSLSLPPSEKSFRRQPPVGNDAPTNG
jgi:hypothetical protein